jgi:hypothetical protein
MTSATSAAIATTSAAFVAITNTQGDGDIDEELLNELNHGGAASTQNALNTLNTQSTRRNASNTLIAQASHHRLTASSPAIAQGGPVTQNASEDAANAPATRAAQSSASGTQNITENCATLSSAQAPGTEASRSATRFEGQAATQTEGSGHFENWYGGYVKGYLEAR